MMTVTELPLGLPGKVYSCPMPYGEFDPDKDTFSQLIKNEVSFIVVLVSDEELIRKTSMNLREVYTDAGMKVIHMPIQDYDVPDTSQLRCAIERAIEVLQDGSNLAIHCSAGIGRTGTFAACLAKHALGVNGKQAVEWIRQSVPGSIETSEQEQFVLDFKFKEVE
jgi:protein-tyrosine phosphatase